MTAYGPAIYIESCPTCGGECCAVNTSQLACYRCGAHWAAKRQPRKGSASVRSGTPKSAAKPVGSPTRHIDTAALEDSQALIEPRVPDNLVPALTRRVAMRALRLSSRLLQLPPDSISLSFFDWRARVHDSALPPARRLMGAVDMGEARVFVRAELSLAEIAATVGHEVFHFAQVRAGREFDEAAAERFGRLLGLRVQALALT